MAAGRVLQCIFLAVLLVLMAHLVARAPAAAAVAEQPYYGYVLYLRAEPGRNLVAEAETIAQPLLKRHRLVDAASSKAWDRTGQAPLSFEQRSGPQRDYGRMETDDGEAFSKLFPPSVASLLPGRSKALITELIVRIGAPGQRDILAYAEGVAVVVALARSLGAPAILDEETRQLLTRQEWLVGASIGRRSGPVSEQNPPIEGRGGGAITHDIFDRGWHTRGMRKLGLADLVVEDYLPGFDVHKVLEIVANVLVAGHQPDERTGDLVIRADDPALKGVVLFGAANGTSTVRLVPARPFRGRPAGRVLEISFDTQPHPSRYERQMRVHLDLRQGLHPGLSNDETLALYLAIARTKAKIKGLRDQFKSLQAAGTRVFVARETYLAIKAASEQKGAFSWAQDWHLVMAWPLDSGHFAVRRWKGDPRAGGEVARLPKPITVGGITYKFHDLDYPYDEIEDVLVIDKNGKAIGGEVTELLKTLLPAVAKRSTP